MAWLRVFKIDLVKPIIHYLFVWSIWSIEIALRQWPYHFVLAAAAGGAYGGHPGAAAAAAAAAAAYSGHQTAAVQVRAIPESFFAHVI